MDADDDGRRQNGDAGVQGVTVQMRITDGADAGTTLNATTDASGSYRFDGVMPGRAELSFTLADGYAFAKNASGDAARQRRADGGQRKRAGGRRGRPQRRKTIWIWTSAW